MRKLITLILLATIAACFAVQWIDYAGRSPQAQKAIDDTGRVEMLNSAQKAYDNAAR